MSSQRSFLLCKSKCTCSSVHMTLNDEMRLSLLCFAFYFSHNLLDSKINTLLSLCQDPNLLNPVHGIVQSVVYHEESPPQYQTSYLQSKAAHISYIYICIRPNQCRISGCESLNCECQSLMSGCKSLICEC